MATLGLGKLTTEIATLKNNPQAPESILNRSQPPEIADDLIG